MEKQASNTFVGGLITDRHPLASQNTELIDAQNIDLLAVGEGYQMILQKREGNESVPNGGLPTGYVPLAVKEFNNIAYILSVAPDGDGEIGTFPSPNYDDFKYTQGTPTSSGITLSAPIWDPAADSASYAFTITPDHTHVVEIDGHIITPGADTDFALFTIANTGAETDTYYVTLTGYDIPNILIYAGSVEYNPAAGVTIGPGSSNDITLFVDVPFNAEPTTEHAVTATIVSQNGSVSSTKTFTCAYKTTVALQMRRSATINQWWTITDPNPWAIASADTVSVAGGIIAYEWRSNVAGEHITFTIVDKTPNTTWLNFYMGGVPANVFAASVTDNTDPLVTPHGHLRIVGAHTALTREVALTQEAP